MFVAYSLLHLDCLPLSLTEGGLPIKTIGQASRQQAQELILALILQAHYKLHQGIAPEVLFAQLFAKQQVRAIA